MTEFIIRLRQTLGWLENVLLTLLLSSMVFLAFSQIFLRNLFDFSFSWGDPMLRILVLWIALVGSMVAARQDSHIRIDILSRWLPDDFQVWNQRLGYLLSALVCGLITWASLDFIQMEMEDGITAFNGIPSWILASVIPIGFGIISLHYLLHVLVMPEKQQP